MQQLFPSSYLAPIDLKELNVISLSHSWDSFSIFFECHLFTVFPDLHTINLRSFEQMSRILLLWLRAYLAIFFFFFFSECHSEHKLWTQSLISYLLPVTALLQSHIQSSQNVIFSLIPILKTHYLFFASPAPSTFARRSDRTAHPV